MTNIDVHNENVMELFLKGNVVFKISAIDSVESYRDVHMVVTKDDYEKRLISHMYSPLLFLINKYQLLAYLYECLNRQYGNQRDENFIFWHRNIGNDCWGKWFTVKPYHDV